MTTSTDRRQQHVAAACAAILAVAAVVAAIAAGRLPTEIPAEFLQLAAAIAGLSALTCAVAAIHAALGRAAAEEARDEADTGEPSIFDNEADAVGRRQQALKQFEKVVVPPLLGVLSLAEAGAAVWFVSRLLAADRPPAPDTAALLPITTVLAVAALIVFIPGKYAAGLAFADKAHFLRPVAGETLLVAIVAGLSAVATLIGFWGYVQLLNAAAWCWAALAVILAVERVALWLVDLYRPHAPGEIALPVYESRILALFSRPRGVLGNLSDVIEYQFGLRVDDKMLGRALLHVGAPLILLQVFTMLALTALVFVAPQQTAVVQQWGNPNLTTLEPGLHVRLPWPAASVTRVDTARIRSLLVELESAPDADAPTDDDARPETWVDARFTDDVMLTAAAADATDSNDVSLATVKLTLQYRVTDPIRWTRNHREPELLLSQLARRALGRLLLAAPFADHLADGGRQLATAMTAAIQEAADSAEIGIEALDVRVRNLQPPANVARAWQEAFAAREDARRAQLAAERFAVVEQAGSAYKSDAVVETARAETIRTRKVATADRELFASMHATYREFPQLHATRAKMDALERALDNKRKIIIAADPNNTVLDLDLKKARPDLIESLGTSE